MDHTPESPDTYRPAGEIEDARDRRWASLLSALADEPGSPLTEITPGRFIIRKGLSAEQLDRESPLRP